ncbi:hypothetical protein LOK49_LG04G01552 [Camellia lanceoleosa]|uniref:Uncharacterized protein n=1 Tax=Camellia lanceoleosa TaxID=1840588 RepID=A0ACC0HV80_9ERIC|nr:hypothetical protein LOK49_LG04G01552 [Camellia lanceoleosa]
MFVIPQFFAATMRAGTNGLEFLSFRTNGSPLKSGSPAALSGVCCYRSTERDRPAIVVPAAVGDGGGFKIA